jgi:rubrerythrin
MDLHTVAEESYKNGYRKGFEDGSKISSRRGRWIKHGEGQFAVFECSECRICGSPNWKVCPVCETRMEVSRG